MSLNEYDKMLLVGLGFVVLWWIGNRLDER